MRIVLTGARAPACLEWARLLMRSGCAVAVADSTVLPIARFSNCIERYFQLPEPVRGASEYGEALAAAAKLFRADWILPTCEEAFYIAHQKRRIERVCRVLVADFDLMARLHDKYTFTQLTQGLPITAPTTWRIESVDALMEHAAKSRDLVFKPIYSRFAARTLIKPGPDDLRKILPTTEQPWVAQQFVSGRELCSYSLLLDGKVTTHACYHPKYRVGNGAGVYLDSVQSDPIQRYVRAFGEATCYTGQVGFDFIRSEDGGMSVLECNPRATSGIHLFQSQAVDIASLFRSSAITPEQTCPILASGSPRMVKIAMMLFAGPKVQGRDAKLEFQRDMARAADIVASHEDRRPALAQWLSLCEVYVRAACVACKPLAATTRDIEWNGQPLGPQP